MHPAEIQAAIKVAGVSQAQIATDCGVAANTVSAVIHGRSRSQRVEHRIADITGLPAEQLWPHWYGSRAMQGVTGLTPEERELVEFYRSLPRGMQHQALPRLRELLSNTPTESSVQIVSASGRSQAAGGNITNSDAATKSRRTR